MVRTNLSRIETRTFRGLFKANFATSRRITMSIYCKNKENKHFIIYSCPLYHETHKSTRFEEFMVQHSVVGHLGQFSSSKRGSWRHIGLFTKHSPMNNYFSNNSLQIIKMFRIKDNVVNHKDFYLIFKDFSRKTSIQVLFKPNINFQGLFKNVRNMKFAHIWLGYWEYWCPKYSTI